MYQLRVLSGSRAGTVLPLTAGTTYIMGRQEDVHLAVPEDKTLSRQHLEIAEYQGQWFIRNKSQHGTLVADQVQHGDQYLAPGVEFTAGATRVVFEAAMAGMPQPGFDPAYPQQPGADYAAAGYGQPAAGAGYAQPAPAYAAAGQDPQAAAPAAAGGGGFGGFGGGAAALASMGAGAGPVRIEVAPGASPPFGDLIKGGLTIFKANMVPAAVLGAPIGLVVCLSILISVLATILPTAVLSILGLVISLVGGLYGLAAPLLFTNFLRGVKEFQASGKRMAIGDYFKFDEIVPRYICCFAAGALSMCFGLGVLLLGWSVAIIVDRPGTPFMNALKGSLAYSKKNIVPNLILFLVLGFVAQIGGVVLGLGLAITQPIAAAAFWLAYELKRNEIAAAAAEAGIQL